MATTNISFCHRALSVSHTSPSPLRGEGRVRVLSHTSPSPLRGEGRVRVLNFL